ncbi:hypothetical protein A2230_03580 [candidate division WOR-1 bacterium RIFOXYA2_FULL_36_21]|uniref:Uncharacterized protein n=1 Tax=candidate division WOR-1 bacterium RIFOXYB2_FULL_36_35 TaxID=1802578 RepID=A0A1F4S173_UNCSA|nr:MAG: hypothetical protein A2230_03580 [candidate division WOR-1 bacterium RIFOXYA2_FULL_36_21]OGC14178.1 MAG: hypothetical protein A2290_00690 [candidate division WOR-1 bacterium RIFOXYB2_FULL_36_35]OGC18778.1 MAG: hypothetical protein A2282_05405 [candidate division WOR-1 bacterium RIFOXYA12_FULL_36_13]
MPQQVQIPVSLGVRKIGGQLVGRPLTVGQIQPVNERLSGLGPKDAINDTKFNALLAANPAAMQELASKVPDDPNKVYIAFEGLTGPNTAQLLSVDELVQLSPGLDRDSFIAQARA